MARADTTIPPLSGEFELSLFGPGVGECVVVHLGHGDWMVVDSCLERDSVEPVAVHYLKNLGVDVKTAVRVVVLTHWHDDHIRGAARLVEACASARVVCSAALNVREFYTLLFAGGQALVQSSGVEDFTGVLGVLKGRAQHGVRAASIGPEWVVAGTTVFRQNDLGIGAEAQVIALSPSSATLTLSHRKLGALLPRAKQPRRRIVALEPNDLAVALWVDAGGVRALLGADLETGRDEQTGWRAIVASAVRPPGRASTLKVPHHGSEGADYSGVWDELLEVEPFGFLTPYTPSRLPRERDLARLRARTSSLYLTAPSSGVTPKPREHVVEKEMKSIAKKRRALRGGVGHVRLRCALPASGGDAHPRIELFEPASRVA
ncbi:MAG: MBL fold metallo-hydrolase [Thermoanaerobaculia bacterium]